MDSLAVWYKSNKERDVYFDIHFNFWKLPASEERKFLIFKEYNYDYFLDIGLMVKDIVAVDKIKIYFPFNITKDQVCDLGRSLQQSTKLTNGIFNEDYALSDVNASPKQKIVKDHDENIKFVIYNLKGDNFNIIENKYNGSLMEIDTSDINNSVSEKFYFRFRILTDKLKKLTRIHESKNSFFQNVFTANEIIDFRLNEKRNYHESMAQKINNESKFIIEKIHFLLLVDAKEEFIPNGINFSCRQLEKGMWQPYINDKYSKRNIVAYHWSKKDERKNKAEKDENEIGIESFNSLMKIKFNETNKKTIFKYIGVLFVLTLFFNICSSYLIRGIDASFKAIVNNFQSKKVVKKKRKELKEKKEIKNSKTGELSKKNSDKRGDNND